MAKRKLNVCFYSPYIPTSTGGGEKHLFDIAEEVSAYADVTFALPNTPAYHDAVFLQQITHRYSEFLNKNLSFVHWQTSPLGTAASAVEKLLWTKKFDYIFYCTDGSLFFSLARHNILHIQVPLLLDKSSIIEKLKLKNWQTINTNSNFTKKMIERSWQTTVNSVIQPKVNTTHFNPKTHKEKIILNVGRFFKQLHSKRQDIAIESFKALCMQYPKIAKEWKFVFVGPIEDESYVQELYEAAQGLPITFYHNISRGDLIALYNKSSIFWHMAGYGVNQSEHPEKVEHFGISTVEAMAAGCVPLVLGKGGQIEVLGDNLKDLLWHKKEECQDKTLDLMNDHDLLKFFRNKVVQRAQVFNQDRFAKQVKELFSLH